MIRQIAENTAPATIAYAITIAIVRPSESGIARTNINAATNTLNVGVSTLQDINGILTQARQLAIQGTNAGNDSTSLNALGDYEKHVVDNTELDPTQTASAVCALVDAGRVRVSFGG